MPPRKTSRKPRKSRRRRKSSKRQRRKSSKRRRRKSSKRRRRKSSKRRRRKSSSRRRRKSSRRSSRKKRRKSNRKKSKTVAIKTNPVLWEKSKRAACTKGGLCKHSARKMQWAVRHYKEHGGGYRGSKANNSLRRWGREKWRTSSGKKSEGKQRYLPDKKWKRLSRNDIQRTNAAKARGYRQGKQYVSQPQDIKKKLWGGECPYTITNHTKRKAKQLGVTVKKAKNSNKKIDVFKKDGKKVATVGACGYKDYPTFQKEDGKDVANRKRQGFKSRFQQYRTQRGTKAYWADQLLW